MSFRSMGIDMCSSHPQLFENLLLFYTAVVHGYKCFVHKYQWIFEKKVQYLKKYLFMETAGKLSLGWDIHHNLGSIGKFLNAVRSISLGLMSKTCFWLHSCLHLLACLRFSVSCMHNTKITVYMNPCSRVP